MFVVSHAPHKGQSQRFHGDWLCDMCRTGERSHVCAVCIWLISKKGLDCVDQDAASSASPSRKNLPLSDVDRARPWQIVSSPCQHLQILRKPTLHDVPAVLADILTLHKLLHQQQGDRRIIWIGRINLKSDGSGRHFRQRKSFQAELFSNCSVKCPPFGPFCL